MTEQQMQQQQPAAQTNEESCGTIAAADEAFAGFGAETASWKSYVWAMVVFAVFAFVYLYGNADHSLWDRDEPRYADAAQTMFNTGQMVVPQFNGETRYDKPVLVYWLMNIPAKIWGINEFSMRFMQSMAGAGVIACVWIFTLMLGFGWRSAFVAAAVCGFSPLLLMVSKASTTDSILLLTIITALMLHWSQLQRGFVWWRHLLFWFILGVSALQKGHPGLIVVGLTVGVNFAWAQWQLRRSLRGAVTTDAEQTALQLEWATRFKRTAAGIGVLLVVVLPWVVAAWVATKGDFFLTQFDKHVLGHAVRTLDSHWGPAVFYIPVLCLASIVALPVMMTAIPGLWRQSINPPVRLLLSWLIPGFFVFSFAGTKLPHYIIPVLPALCILIGYSLTCWPQIRSWRPVPRPGIALTMAVLALVTLVCAVIWRKSPTYPTLLGTISLACLLCAWWYASMRVLWAIGTWIVLVGGVVIGLGIPSAMVYFQIPNLLVGFLGGFVLCGLSAWAAYCWLRRELMSALGAGIAMKLVLSYMIFGVLFPGLEPLRPSKPVGQWLNANMPADAKLFMVGYKEPSLVFYSARVVAETGSNPDERAKVYAALSDETTSAALVTTQKEWNKWTSDLPAPASAKTVHFEQDFFQFQKGGKLQLLVITN